MNESRLLIDIGNTRLKWAQVDARAPLGQWQAQGVVVHHGDVAAALDELPARAQSLWISHVLGVAVEATLIHHARARWKAAPQIARSAAQWRQLRNGYAQPERMGVDRWLAMIGARAQCAQGALCVVDAGTALTVDVVRADGQHLGGLICAGLATQQRALLGDTHINARTQPPHYHGGLGSNTETCISQGAMLACLGAIDRARQSLTGPVHGILCGGDAPTLLPHLSGDWQHQPHLVLQGLQVLAAGDANTAPC